MMERRRFHQRRLEKKKKKIEKVVQKNPDELGGERGGMKMKTTGNEQEYIKED